MSIEFVTPRELVDSMPIEKGDIVLLASDVKKIALGALKAKEKFDFQLLINLVQDKIGETGTLLFPTYNWGFCQGKTFYYRETKSATGSLSQLALERKDFIRTKHAFYNFAVWGKDARLLYEMDDHNSFVGNTPFCYLHNAQNAKMLSIDVNLTHCLTFVHYVEECNKAPYRFKKVFVSDYADEEGKVEQRSYSMYVRDLDINGIVDFSKLEELLLQKGLLYRKNVNYSMVRCVRFKDVYREVEEDIKNNMARSIVQIDENVRKQIFS